MNRRLHLLPLLILNLGISIAIAGTTGKVAGEVKDKETGEPLIGSNVIIEGTTLGAATGLDGSFVILNVSPGTYSVSATMIGYQAVIAQNIVVSIDLTTKVDFELGVEVIGGEAVTVIAERPLVVHDLTSSEARVSSEQLATMPVTDIWDVLAIQSGVTQDAGGGIHIRGGRSSEVAYWVDGVSVTDVYDGGLAIGVENNAIQELQVISGTFNAEYGQAMSGIINLVTKDGGQDYAASFSGYIGDYYSKDPTYLGLDALSLGNPGNTPEAAPISKKNPVLGRLGNELNLQGSLSGPVPLLGKWATFYTTARHNRDNGYLNALRVFDMYENLAARLEPPDDEDVPYEKINLGGYELWAEIVPLNWREKVTSNSKLTFQLTNRLKFKLSLLTSDESYQDWNHDRQLAPDGEPFRFNKGRDMGLGLTHSLSAKTFYELRLSRFYKAYQEYLFSTPLDRGYVDQNFIFHIQARIMPVYSFDTYGISLHRFQRQSTTDVAKFDLMSQVTPSHQLKFGAEYRLHQLTLDDYDLTDEDMTDSVFTIKIPEKALDSFNRRYYDVSPFEMSIYLQDKIEYESVILNIGLRWDLFDAQGQVPTNPVEPYIGNPRNATLDDMTIEERENVDWTPFADIYDDSTLIGATGWWTKTKPRQHLSPRIGIAYPISDRGVIHFSFGHFFQIPPFRHLYDNPDYKIPETSGRFGIFCNPALKPQQTVTYELGLRQAAGENWSFDITSFYRDVRSWVSTGIPINLGGGASYFTYINKDYSNVRGVTINLDKRYSQSHAISLNYTYQVAEGSNSDPDDEYGANERGEEPPRSIIPLEWDQRHTINGTIYIGTDRWGATLLGRFGSGYPYTPSFVTGTLLGRDVSVALVENSRRKPVTYSFDLKLSYSLDIIGAQAQLFLNVYNLFDRRNEQTVYGDTGRTNRSLEELRAKGPAYESPLRPNTIADYFNRPDWYAPPRQIQIGLNIRL